MEEIELVIKIDKDDYEARQHWVANQKRMVDKVDKAIANGIPLLKGHGRLIDQDHMIARLEAASKFYGGENADAFDKRFSHGLKEAAIRVAEEPTIIEADKGDG